MYILSLRRQVTTPLFASIVLPFSILTMTTSYRDRKWGPGALNIDGCSHRCLSWLSEWAFSSSVVGSAVVIGGGPVVVDIVHLREE